MLGAYCRLRVGRLPGRVRSAAARASFWLGVVLAALVVALIGALIEVLLLKRLYARRSCCSSPRRSRVVLIVRDAVLAVWGAEDLLGPRAPGLAGTFELVRARRSRSTTSS